MEEKTNGTVMPEDNDTVTAKKAISFLSKRKIAINPANFQIWFDFFRGDKEEVVTHLKDFYKGNEPFTPGMVEEITKKFYTRDFNDESTKQVLREIKAAEEVSRKASELLVAAMKEIISSAKAGAEFGSKLDGYIKRVEKANKIEDIEAVLKELLKDTADAANNSRQTEERLNNSTKQLETLNNELEKAREEAYTDTLTRLFNRRYFDKSLSENLAQVSRSFLCSLIVLDIDFFKRFNDNFGHQVGDNLLRTFAKELKGCCPAEAIPCRYGGEEFAVVFPKANVGRAERLAEEIRGNIEEMEFTVRGKEVSVTVSAGVSQAREGESVQEVIERADKALYMAKYLGRNRVRKETKI